MGAVEHGTEAKCRAEKLADPARRSCYRTEVASARDPVRYEAQCRLVDSGIAALIDGAQAVSPVQPETRCVPQIESSLSDEHIELASPHAVGATSALPFRVELKNFEGALATYGSNGVHQLVASTAVDSELKTVEFEIRHFDRCQAVELPVEVEVGGQLTLLTTDGEFVLTNPWALDSTGKDLVTRFDVREGRLYQAIDVGDAVGAIISTRRIRP